MTFDFPGRKIFLRAGENFKQPDYLNSSGLGLVFEKGEVLIASVDEDSPGESSGFKASDVLLRIGMLSCSQASIFQVEGALTKNPIVKCAVRRGTRIQALTLTR